jgi:hypothetical protein
MTRDAVAAEVVPVAGKSVEAAKALQKLGFKVFHVADTGVSAQGPQTLWEKTFRVTFAARTKEQAPGRAVSYRRVEQDPVPIPAGLDDLIRAVAFAEPPELF